MHIETERKSSGKKRAKMTEEKVAQPKANKVHMKMIFIIYYFRKDSIWDVQTMYADRDEVLVCFSSHLIFTFVQIIHGSAFECHAICFTVTNGTNTGGTKNRHKTTGKKILIDNAACIWLCNSAIWHGLNIHNKACQQQEVTPTTTTSKMRKKAMTMNIHDFEKWINTKRTIGLGIRMHTDINY